MFARRRGASEPGLGQVASDIGGHAGVEELSTLCEVNMNAKRWFAGFLLLASLGGCVVTPVGYRYNDGYDGYRGYDRHRGYDC